MRDKLHLALLGVVAVFISYYVLGPTYYIIVPTLTRVQAEMQMLQYWIPLLLLPPIYFPKVLNVLKPLTHRPTWMILLVCLTLLFVGLSVAKTPGLWWSWKTLGLVTTYALIILIMSRNKLPDHHALYLAVGASFFVAGSWELAHNTAIFFYHPEFGTSSINLMLQLSYDALWIVVGGGITASVWWWNHTNLRASKLTLGFAIAGASLFLLWITTTNQWMPIEWYDNGARHKLVANNTYAWVVIHLSKVFWYGLVATTLFHTTVSTIKAADYYTTVERYDWVTDPKYPEKILHNLRTRHIMSLVKKCATHTDVLDLGCGTGLITRNLPGKVTGIDINPWNIERARMHCPKAILVVGNVEEPLPFAPNSFDVVVCTDVLEHVERPQRLIHNALTVLKPNGYFVGEVPSNNPVWRLREFLTATCPVSEPFHLNFSTSKIAALLAEFKTVETQYAVLGMEVSFVAQKGQNNVV